MSAGPDQTTADIAVIGAGAAGLFAAIHAGREARGAGAPLGVVALDGAAKIGAKILVAGGGRCNVTHHEVDERAYATPRPRLVRNVLREFGVRRTVEFFAELGVELKREETGKLFPTTDRAGTVLDALHRALRGAGATLRHPARVESVERAGAGFRLAGAWGELLAARVVLATGGKSLPKTGSDGGGYELARGLGHTITDHVFPALVPLKLEEGHCLRALSGLTVDATIDLWSGSGRRLRAFTGSTLCTHFGLSGPSVLDISRYHHAALLEDPSARLTINWLPGETADTADRALLALGKGTARRWLRERLPERLAEAVCLLAGVDPQTPGAALRKEERRALAQAATAMPLPVTGDRGWLHAEVTAGGVPLDEIDTRTMESRICPGLFLCGEICDVDGRIGGFNFQWAWASGYLAGRSAARAAVEAGGVVGG